MKKAIALVLALSMALALCACGGEKTDTTVPDRASASFVGGGLGQAGASGPEASAAPGGETQPQATTAPTAPSETKPVESSPTETAPQQTQPSQAAQLFSNEAGTSIDVLREEITWAGAAFGVAYIGYFEYYPETGIDFDQWYMSASSPLVASYPFAAEIDENHTVGSQGHLYCILARDFDATITVTAPDGRTLYRAENGDPILVFCNLDGYATQPDINVEIGLRAGASFDYGPALDQQSLPQLLIGAERQLLSWDFTPLEDIGFEAENTGFDVDGWLAEGWLGVTAMGLAYDANGLTWQYTTWDGSRTYNLTFWLMKDDAYDGDLLLECDGADGFVLGQWQGWWRAETAMDQPTRLWLDLTWIGGSNQTEFAAASALSESCLVMISPSGEDLLLVAENDTPAAPIFPEGEQASQWSLSYDFY